MYNTFCLNITIKVNKINQEKKITALWCTWMRSWLEAAHQETEWKCIQLFFIALFILLFPFFTLWISNKIFNFCTKLLIIILKYNYIVFPIFFLLLSLCHKPEMYVCACMCVCVWVISVFFIMCSHTL